jgi:hypothetical protein
MTLPAVKYNLMLKIIDLKVSNDFFTRKKYFTAGKIIYSDRASNLL